MDINFLFEVDQSAPRFQGPEQMLSAMSGLDYVEFTQLMAPDEVIMMNEGSCHDQTMLEYDELECEGLSPAAKFIMAVDKDNIGGETHSFVYWVENGKAYWFENAWEDYRGIHEFDSEADLIEAVVDAFTERNPRKYIYISDFNPAEHTIGEDLDTFVDICMNNAELA